MKINIIGNGVFGTFLKKCFSELIELSEDADIVILAVPISAYKDVAKKHAGKHLINVCSVQMKTNEICGGYSKYVTGIHPVFGPNSPKSGRTCIVTKTCEKSNEIIGLFEKKGCEIVTHI
ncbi:MAG: prephenate dehydrogenase/arogenate dehydrogenase family protein, partial [Alphaproteobacteria bacterium]|nr:prephenate dehydrogenase/arogenate dehydrogenase family protein [Alphaproteobacteria bacterium]